MGYETHFRLKGELDNKFKSWRKEPSTEGEITEQRNVLIAQCMNFNTKSSDMVELTKIYRSTNFGIRMLVNMYTENWKLSLQNELAKENNETWFCGWECCRNDGTWESEDAVINWFTEQLFFEIFRPHDGDDAYFDRLQALKESLEDLEECSRECMRYQFIERYRNSEDAEESDGYERKFSDEDDESDDE